jgi:hypothetical protein
MTRLDNGRGNVARLQWIKSKVLSVCQLIVGKDLFVVIIIDGANKLHVSRLPEEFTFMFTNTFANLLFIDNIEDLCTMSLPVFLIYEEGMTDKFRGINDRHRR